MLGVPGQYKIVVLLLGYKLDFSCCANKDGFAETVTCTKTNVYAYLASYNVMFQA